MSPEHAMQLANTYLAHAWMVRTFLKHSEEIADDEEMLNVHRTLFDAIRALEPSYQRHDAKEYLRRLKGKMPKLRRVADFFTAEYRKITDHTNFQMAALSLQGCVQQLEELLAQLEQSEPVSPATD